MSIEQGISILMPSYNQGEYISEAIESVLTQGLCNIELIVMDGGSTDGTLKILESFSNHIIFRSEKDNGQSDALNKALKYVKYPITGWLNADDKYLSGVFTKIQEKFTCHPEISLIYGKRVLIDNRSRCIGWSNTGQFLPSSGNFNICSETAFWKTGCLNNLIFKEELQFAMDLHFLGSIAKFNKHKFIDTYIGCFRCHEKSKSSTLWHEVAIPEASEEYYKLFGRCVLFKEAKNHNFLHSFIYQLHEYTKLPLSLCFSYAFKKLNIFTK